jgi:hypothetical protein
VVSVPWWPFNMWKPPILCSIKSSAVSVAIFDLVRFFFHEDVEFHAQELQLQL